MRSKTSFAQLGVVLVAAAWLGGCGGGHSSSSQSGAIPTTSHGPTLAQGFRLTSHAFPDGGMIPATYTCDGRDTSPPLRWSGVPAGTRELVLVMRDPDAPAGNFVHWALAGIPTSLGGLPAGSAPSGLLVGRNSFGSLGYRGPCPPRGGHAHHYVLTLSALSARSGLRPKFNPEALRTSALGIATLTASYSRG